jgi:AAA15 family ATPase/GTPase
MYIESIAIKNYKSFLDFGPITFGPGFNVIVGSNNAGKTALLEAQA